ncbi:MAG: hypothetical protein ABR990_08480 [Terracidiphilus sp.]|jgi:hypothetical protein
MNHDDWADTTATIYSCGWEDTPGRGFVLRSLSGLFSGQYIIVFSYTIYGKYFSGEFTSYKEWKEGSTFPLKYNPQNPEETDREDEEINSLTTIASFVVSIMLIILYFWWKARK